MTTINRIVLSGGGTGGHIYPAISIYKRLKELNPDLEALYIGSDKGLEASIVPEMGLTFQPIKVQGLSRSFSLETLRTLGMSFNASRQARRLIKDFQPDVVVGTGGYVCGPVLLAAASLRIPTLIHEQNSVAGLSNKLLAPVVDRIAISFEAVADDFAKYRQKVVLTGNPRGQEVIQYPEDRQLLSRVYGLQDKQRTVLIFGGSRGAPAINQAALQSIEAFGQRPYQVIIVTGKDHYETAQANVETLPENVKLLAYVEDMPALFNAVDLVVCRSGATTLTELTALGLASLLIPSPYVTDDHQTANAMALVSKGAARMISEDRLTSSLLLEELNSLLLNPSQLRQMQQSARMMGITNATDLIIDELQAIL